MADYDRAMFRIEAGLKAQAPDGGAMDIMMFDPRPTGWRCGRVRFANPAAPPHPSPRSWIPTPPRSSSAGTRRRSPGSGRSAARDGAG
jgi:hypothetical protein